jgi:alkylation response protein AidB-like acyl-CoA dehydrogenase
MTAVAALTDEQAEILRTMRGEGSNEIQQLVIARRIFERHDRTH